MVTPKSFYPILLAFIFIGEVSNGFGQQTNLKEPASYVDNFLKEIIAGSPEKGAQYIYDLAGRSEEETEPVRTKIGSGLKEAAKNFGRPSYYKILGQSSIDDHITFVYAYVLYQHQPIFFRLIFFKPESKWIFYGVKYFSLDEENIFKLSSEKMLNDIIRFEKSGN